VNPLSKFLTFICLLVCLAADTWGADPYVTMSAAPKAAVDISYFGMHFHRLALNPGELGPRTSWPSVSIGGLRLWDAGVQWMDMAPTGGVWRFDRLDHLVDLAHANGASVLYPLGTTPRWMSSRPEEPCPYGKGCAAEPVRLAHWEEYVRRIAQRYTGRISAYEVWNEPFFTELKARKGESDFFYGSAKQMVEMARLARRTLDDIDPAAVLTTPGFTGDERGLDLFLSEGGKNYIQAVAFHFYASSSEEFARKVSAVRKVMEKHGVGHLPLWNTETGVETTPPEDARLMRATPAREAAAALWSQLLILGTAAGIERFYYYAWDNYNSGMVTSTGDARFGYEEFRRLQGWLLNSQALGCKGKAGAVFCEANQNGNHYVYAWSDKADVVSVQFPFRYRIVAAEKLFTMSARPTTNAAPQDRVILDSAPTRFLVVPL
jgi:hypothetical protein